MRFTFLYGSRVSISCSLSLHVRPCYMFGGTYLNPNINPNINPNLNIIGNVTPRTCAHAAKYWGRT